MKLYAIRPVFLQNEYAGVSLVELVRQLCYYRSKVKAKVGLSLGLVMQYT